MEKNLFIFGEDGTKKNCWLEFKDCKRNQYIESIVDEYFQDLILSTRKKKSYRLALAYLLTTIFRLLRRVESDEKYTWILWQDSYDNEEIDKQGFKYRFSWSKKYPRKDEQLYRKDYYLYGAERIRKDFLFKIFKLLEQRDIVRRGKKGYSILPRNSYSLAFIYINWRKVYNDIYLINKDNYIKSSPKLDRDTERQPIVIRTQDDKGKYTNLITKGKLKSISRRQEIKDTKIYLERLTELYNSMDLSLSYFKQGTIPQREEVINQWLLKDKGYFCKDTFNHNVDILNIYLQSNWSPYRLYHLTDNKLSLGRIYGGPLDTKVSNIYKPLLKINETYTISLDIKSCFTQLFVLENCKNIDNNQDFYYYNSLDGILTRSDIKQITQNLIFCNERMTAYRAYVRKQTENKSVYTRIPTYQEFSNFVELMINERRYLKKLFNQRDMTKEIFHIESNLMIPISNNLMDTGINHITLFDAIYIPYNNLQQSLDIIRDISKQKYNKEINLDYNKSIYNSLL